MDIARVKSSLPGKLLVKFTEDRAINWAVLIAWSALLALFPIILVMVSILGLVLSHAGVTADHLYQNILAILPPDQARQDALTALGQFKRQSGPLAIVGFAGLLFGGSALFGAMEQAFAVIYHTRPRSFVRQKLMSFGMILVFTLLAGVAVGTSSLVPILSKLPFAPAGVTAGPVVWVIQVVTGVVAGLLLFLAMFYVVPNRQQAWRQVWPGALLAALLFEVLTLLFPLYLQVNKGINAYGQQFGLMFLLMTFFFFLGIITMVGVEFNSVLYLVPVQPQDQADQPRRAGAGLVGATPETADQANAGIAAPAAARGRVGKARTIVGVGAIAWALGVVIGERAGRSRGTHPHP
jgi:membrane protein